jgi:hypothetical protein
VDALLSPFILRRFSKYIQERFIEEADGATTLLPGPTPLSAGQQINTSDYTPIKVLVWALNSLFAISQMLYFKQSAYRLFLHLGKFETPSLMVKGKVEMETVFRKEPACPSDLEELLLQQDPVRQEGSAPSTFTTSTSRASR